MFLWIDRGYLVGFMIHSVIAVSFVFSVGCVSGGAEQIIDARSANGLAYDLVGDGPLVVLIHGTNLDRRMWDHETEWLEGHVRVLRYDLRGQGGSDFPADAYSNHNDLIELLDELQLNDATLIGLSAGAQVALDVALAAPRLVERMVLVSPSIAGYVPDETPDFLPELMRSLQAGDFDEANEVLLASPLMSVPPEHAGRVRTMVEENSRLWTIPQDLVESLLPPTLDRLEDISTPTLVLVGANDVRAIRTQGVLLERRLAEATEVTIPDGGHLLNLTSSESFRRALSEFHELPLE